MPSPGVVPDERLVYRGLRNSNWAKAGKITWKAYILRAATLENPIPEEYASVGLTKESAVDELREYHGWAELLVGKIHSLPHGLIARFDGENDQKAGIYGLPLHSTEPKQIDMARSMATDLAGISEYLPPD
jgi:hypothetical protein